MSIKKIISKNTEIRPSGIKNTKNKFKTIIEINVTNRK